MAKLTRAIGDALLKKVIALPNADDTVNTNYIDLGSVQPYPTNERFLVRVAIDDATGANNCNVNAVIQHCDDTNTDNFTNIAGFGAPFLVAAGNDSNVIGASRLATLPPGTKRYVRAQATGESDGGNSADGNLTLDLVF